MKTHFDYLSAHVPNLLTRRILDIGSGRGAFLVDACRRGANAVGVEPYALYREETQRRASRAGLSVTVLEGAAERLPFPSHHFDFVNMAEVIEHVEDDTRALSEACRVLAPGGYAYVSIPNRFGVRDPHYHLYFVNWLPRTWSAAYIRFFGKEKDIRGETGRQLLSDMHYMTFSESMNALRQAGFRPFDSRENVIIKRFTGLARVCALFLYRMARPIYFDSFHLIARKEESP